MPSRSLPAFFVLGVFALSLAGCGRAGPLEAPPRPGETQAQQQNKAQQTVDDDETTTSPMSPIPTAQKQPKRPITVPNKPFILDPIL